LSRDVKTPHCPISACSNSFSIVPHGFYKTKSGRRRRYRCTSYGKTFCSTRGTPYYRLQHRRSTFDEVASLSVEGVSKSAIARVKRIAWNTVDRWLERASECCRRFNDTTITGLDVPEIQADEGPVHSVTLSPFLIGKYEVTQAEYEAVMGENPSWSSNLGNRNPVEQVSRDGIQVFEDRTGLSLPSEAQWEYACRAGQSGPYSGTGSLDDMGWYLENSERRTHRVGRKAANGFGLHDMHGNVSEWCEDVWDLDFYGTVVLSWTDLTCPQKRIQSLC
jgi:transposase-like protein